MGTSSQYALKNDTNEKRKTFKRTEYIRKIEHDHITRQRMEINREKKIKWTVKTFESNACRLVLS